MEEKTFGSVIKKILKYRGITQLELADKIGLSKTGMNYIITGITGIPKKETVKKICNVLEVPEVMIHLYSLNESDIKNKEVYVFTRQMLINYVEFIWGFKDDNLNDILLAK